MSIEMEKGKPGVMFYFDMMPMLEELNNIQIAQLICAILAYGQDGVLPEFEDATLRALWPLMQKRVELDDEAYRHKVEVRRKAAMKRWGKTHEDESANESPAMQTMPASASAAPSATTAPSASAPDTTTKSVSVSKRNQEKNAWVRDYIR